MPGEDSPSIPRDPTKEAAASVDAPAAVFDHYSFARGSRAEVAPARGVLQNDVGHAPLLASAGTLQTERGGVVELAASGGFVYSAPSREFWGDDHFTYSLASAAPAGTARVRLTVQPGLIFAEEVLGGNGNGFSITGGYPADVAGAGDVNGDGLADLVVGSEGNAYVIFGKVSPASATFTALASGEGGFVIHGAVAGDGAGAAVSSAGDVNGDGVDDVVIGAPSAPGGGAAYVVFGKTGREPVELSALGGNGFVILPSDPSLGFSPTVAQLGAAVSAAGDVDADGLGDVIVASSGVGSDGTGPASDANVFIILGRRQPSAIYLFDGGGAEVAADRVVQFELAEGHTPASVAGAGDFNGDGVDDVLIGTSASPGQIHLMFGRPGIEGRFPIELMAPSRGFVLSGSDVMGSTGDTVAAAGDVNGDGLGDIVIGGHTESPTEFTAGQAYVVFGRRGSAPFALDLLREQQSAGFPVEGVNTNDFVGKGVGTAGDLDGDGLSDVLVGAFGSDVGAINGGAVYVVFATAMGKVVSLGPLRAQGRDGLAVAGTIERRQLGVRVHSAGDVNGDGLGDFIIGPQNDTAYVMLGWDANDALGVRDRALVGTSADDTLTYSREPLVSVDGGHGFDKLRVLGDGVELDLRQRTPHVESIESIDLSGGGGSVLRLGDDDIRNLPDARPGPVGLVKTLVVEGDGVDTLDVDLGDYVLRPQRNAGRLVYESRSGPYGLEVSPTLTCPSCAME